MAAGAAPVYPLEAVSDNVLFRKTQICKFYAKGKCKRGSGCSFAHGGNDLQGTHDLYRTRFCFAFQRTGSCAAGDACNFAHTSDELRATAPLLSPQGAGSCAAPRMHSELDGQQQTESTARSGTVSALLTQVRSAKVEVNLLLSELQTLSGRGGGRTVQEMDAAEDALQAQFAQLNDLLARLPAMQASPGCSEAGGCYSRGPGKKSYMAEGTIAAAADGTLYAEAATGSQVGWDPRLKFDVPFSRLTTIEPTEEEADFEVFWTSLRTAACRHPSPVEVSASSDAKQEEMDFFEEPWSRQSSSWSRQISYQTAAGEMQVRNTFLHFKDGPEGMDDDDEVAGRAEAPARRAQSADPALRL